MSTYYDDINKPLPTPVQQNEVWRGVISRDVAEISDVAWVIFPLFAADLEWGPCRWQSRDATSLPAKGDHCLTVMDDYRELWIIAWWPKEFEGAGGDL